MNRKSKINEIVPSMINSYGKPFPDLNLGKRFLQSHQPPGRILLCAVTGSHLYGFPSKDSDLDLKGTHLNPTNTFLGLDSYPDSYDITETFEGTECDLTTNEVGKFLNMLLAGNGNMLERIMSPFQVINSSELPQLQGLAKDSLSLQFFKHYLGYFRGMQAEHDCNSPPRVKTLLYTFRVALTGVHLLLLEDILPDLNKLADIYNLSEIHELISRKKSSSEKAELSSKEDSMYRAYWPRLQEMLEDAKTKSKLPLKPPNRDKCNSWLIELRTKELGER